MNDFNQTPAEKKLADIIKNALGNATKSYFDKEDISAIYNKKILETPNASVDIIDIKIESSNFDNSEPSLLKRSQDRRDFQEQKKQQNLEKIATIAFNELKDDSNFVDESIEDDWTTRFFNISEDISDEQMQALWGKILAGEIKQPKTYSLRTLELIKNLSKNEADTFNKVANFAIKVGNANFLFKTNNDKLLSEVYNINYADIALLTEIGLIQPGDFVSYQHIQDSADSQKVFISANIVIIANIKANTPTIQMPVNVFTNAGNELIQLIHPKPPFDYLTAVAKSIKNENVDVKYGSILAWEGDNIRHTYPLQEFN
jgi:uncharacterized repeat protein (TIGR03899 family)